MNSRHLRFHDGEQITLSTEGDQWRAAITDRDGEPLRLRDYKGNPVTFRLWTELEDAAGDARDAFEEMLEQRYEASLQPETREEREASEGFDAAKMAERKSA